MLQRYKTKSENTNKNQFIFEQDARGTGQWQMTAKGYHSRLKIICH
jgi:hypothetical protein